MNGLNTNEMAETVRLKLRRSNHMLSLRHTSDSNMQTGWTFKDIKSISISNRMNVLVWAAITKVSKTGGLITNKHSGGWKSKIKGLADLISGECLLSGSQGSSHYSLMWQNDQGLLDLLLGHKSHSWLLQLHDLIISQRLHLLIPSHWE